MIGGHCHYSLLDGSSFMSRNLFRNVQGAMTVDIALPVRVDIGIVLANWFTAPWTFSKTIEKPIRELVFC